MKGRITIMEKTADKRKRRKKPSQAPVALIYFVTLLLFLGIFGLVAKLIIDKLSGGEPETPDLSQTTIESYNTLYARVNDKDVLSDLSVIRIAPEHNKIAVIPLSAFTVSDTDGVSTFREIYADGGIRQLQQAVDTTLGIKTDYYFTISNQIFEDCMDIIGGFVYAPEEELYYLSPTNDNDISLRENEPVSLSGLQIRLICQYPVFSEGRQGNTEFLGTALTSIINSAFDQADIIKDSLDLLYNKTVDGSNTNMSENDYKSLRVYIKQMLDNKVQPAYALVPEGQWTDEKHFIISAEYKNKLYNEMESTKASAEVQTESGETQ